MGARAVLRDGEGVLHLAGADETAQAKLVVDSAPQFVTASKPATPAVSTKAAPKKETPIWKRRLADDRVVTFKGRYGELTIGVAPLGAEPLSFAPFGKDPSSTRHTAAGYRGTVVVAWAELDDDKPSTWHLRRTVDDGKSWEDLGELRVTDGTRFDLSVGPSWVAVSGVCGENDAPANPKGATCRRTMVKIGTKDWQALEVPGDRRVVGALFDPPRNRVVLTTLTSSKLDFYGAKLDEAKLTGTQLTLPYDPRGDGTLDAKGILRVVQGNQLLRFDAELAPLPALYLPFAPTGVGLSGDHGFAHTRGQAWETGDGGEHWAKVASAGGSVSCSTSGCLVGEDITRVGWELPNEKLALFPSTPSPSKAKPGESTPEPAPPKAALKPVSLECSQSGKWSTIPGTLVLHPAIDGDVRFLSSAPTDDESVVITVARGGAAPKTLSLLAAQPKPAKSKSKSDIPEAARVRYDHRSDAHGYAAARYSFFLESKGNTKYNPVDVELGWYSAATGKVGKAKLKQVSPFRVGSFGPNAVLAIVDGGLLFMPTNGAAPLYRISEDGKVTELARPPETGRRWTEGAVASGTTYLASALGDDVVIASTTDGKSWKTAIWTTGSRTDLEMIDGKPRLTLFNSAYLSNGLLDIEAFGTDPTEAVPLDVEGGSLAEVPIACSSKLRLGHRSELVHGHSYGGRTFAITVQPEKGGPSWPLTELTHVARTGLDGTSCTDALIASDKESEWTALVPPHDLAHGWLVRKATGAKAWARMEVRPLTCSLTK